MPAKNSYLDAARDLHRRALVIDAHIDTTQRLLNPDWDFMNRHSDGHVDYPRLTDGGVAAVFLAVYKAGPLPTGHAPQAARLQLARIHDLARRHPRRLALARTPHDVRRARREDRLALLIGIEGGYFIEESLDLLCAYHQAGATYMTLTHGFHTAWADSSGVHFDLVPRHGGLTDFGRAVIREMNRLGMMVDVSHVSDATFRDVATTSSAPIVATHSSCRALSPHRRNLSDDMLRAIADSGGVAQMNLCPAFIDPTFPQPRNETDARGAPPPHDTPLAVFVDHIEHALRVVGPDHVGIGTDFDGIRAVPVGLEDCSKLPHVTAELLRRGHSEQTLIPLLGENLLRVMDACQSASAAGGRATDPAQPSVP